MMLDLRKMAVVMILVAAFSIAASAQWMQDPETGSAPERVADRTKMSGMSGLGPQLEVGLVKPGENAKKKQAVVAAKVWGIDLITPGSYTQPNLTKGYLVYRVDEQPVIKTADKEVTFRNLSPGYHAVTVQLSSPDGHLVGARMVLAVHIPG